MRPWSETPWRGAPATVVATGTAYGEARLWSVGLSPVETTVVPNTAPVRIIVLPDGTFDLQPRPLPTGINSVEGLVRDLARRGEHCKVYGHRWDAPAGNVVYQSNGDHLLSDPEARKCCVCARRESREWRESK